MNTNCVIVSYEVFSDVDPFEQDSSWIVVSPKPWKQIYMYLPEKYYKFGFSGTVSFRLKATADGGASLWGGSTWGSPTYKMIISSESTVEEYNPPNEMPRFTEPLKDVVINIRSKTKQY